MPPTSTTGTGPKRMLTLGAKVRSRYNCKNEKKKLKNMSSLISI